MTEITECKLFSDLEAEQLESAMSFFHARKRKLPKGYVLHQAGDKMTFFGLILTGAVEVAMDDYDGQHIIMAVVGPGGAFGESLCFLGRESEVSVTALEESEIVLLSAENLYRPHHDEWEAELCKRFTAMLASRTLEMNQRIQILSMSTLRKKILLFLSVQASGQKNREFRIHMDRAGLAAYLGADRSALSRELSAMKKAGLITYRKNSFELL